MINKKEFLGENYENFKKEAEDLIYKYHFGTFYKTELKETRVNLEDIVSITSGSPVIYLKFCSLYKFLNDFYNLDYVKKIIDFAKENGFSFVLPEEKRNNYDMDKFAISAIRKKSREHLSNINYYFDLTFSKKIEDKSMNIVIPILDYSNERFYVQERFDIINGINQMEQ